MPRLFDIAFGLFDFIFNSRRFYKTCALETLHVCARFMGVSWMDVNQMKASFV